MIKRNTPQDLLGMPYSYLRGLTVNFANSSRCACRGNSGKNFQCGLMTLPHQFFTGVLLLIYGSLFLSGVCYFLSVLLVCRRENDGT
jgi:hypothetical protein